MTIHHYIASKKELPLGRNGAEMLVHARLANQEIVIKCKTDETLKMDDRINLRFNQEATHIFDKMTEKRLTENEIQREALLTSC